MMRIAHLKVGAGGASQTAELLNHSLYENGIDSSILPNVFINNSYLAKVKSKKTTLLNMLDAKSHYEFLSSKSTDRILNIHKIKETYSLLHIHNWYNLLSPSQLSKISRIMPVVITAHDERLLTGGCHTTLGCSEYLNGCSKCPASKFLNRSIQKSLQETNNLNYEKIGIVTPSVWLREKIQRKLQHIDVNQYKLASIPNLIDPIFFNFANKKGIHTDREKFNILFVAANTQTKIKNLKTLVEAHQILRRKSPSYRTHAQLHLVGAGGIDYKNTAVISHGFLSKPELQQLMGEIDLCCIPSIADNFPSVVAESQLSSVYVLGSNVGGIPEMLDMGSMGDLFTPTVEELVDSIEIRFMKRKIDSFDLIKDIRNKATEKYDRDEIVRNHLSLYSRVINEWAPQR